MSDAEGASLLAMGYTTEQPIRALSDARDLLYTRRDLLTT